LPYSSATGLPFQSLSPRCRLSIPSTYSDLWKTVCFDPKMHSKSRPGMWLPKIPVYCPLCCPFRGQIHHNTPQAARRTQLYRRTEAAAERRQERSHPSLCRPVWPSREGADAHRGFRWEILCGDQRLTIKCGCTLCFAVLWRARSHSAISFGWKRTFDSIL